MQAFQDILDECGFMELDFVGFPFTWHKHYLNFEQMWMSEKGCNDTVEAVWSINSTKSWDTHILRKIKKCGAALSWWSKKSFGSIKKQLEVVRT